MRWYPRYPGSCFLAGTLIDTPGGARPIETIGLGDPVITWDTGSNKLATPAQVTKLHRNQAKSHLKLALTDGVARTVVLTTSDHPFFLPDFNIAWAGALKPGDAVLMRKDSGLARVVVASTEEIPGDVTVYNITVPPHHNYFANGILVHNR
ncbi:MAG: Hint domain-containing protein [Elusimicrobia bacterium]|nr:Hint domain-containing protein [Elusimicrobiota bacterium]